MQDVVIIPTYDRPEMLWLCLEHLAASEGSLDVLFLVYVDAHLMQPAPPIAEIHEVLRKFPQLALRVGYRQPHPYQGNSFNLMMAYKDAYESAHRYVFMVEDDVLVHPEFFVWHHTVQREGDVGVSIAVQNPGHNGYSSLGVCFRRDMLRLIVPHCVPKYFKAMRMYCKEMFPQSKFDCEQDGLWARVLQGHPKVWASTPYAQHVGWYGYHRMNSVRPQGTLEVRYLQVKQALSSTASLKPWVKDFWDIDPIRNPCT